MPTKPEGRRTRVLLLTMAVVLAMAPSALAGDLTARYLGQMAVQLTDGERTIVFDFPFRPGHAGAPEEEPFTRPFPPDTLCLITHSHLDHFDPERAGDVQCTVAGPEDVLKTLPATRTRPLDGAFTWKGVGILPVRTEHAGLEHWSYRLDWDGFRIYLSGDTDDPTELLAQRGIDVAFVTPWLLSKPRILRRLDARRIVLVHHGENTTAPGCGHCFLPEVGQLLRLRAAR